METTIDVEAPFRVSDLKQWVYCPRVLYYQVCLPKVRPVTYKMIAGKEAGMAEEGREQRRSLKSYGLKEEGRREFEVPLLSSTLGLSGKPDMVIWLDATREVIPVDYKLSNIAGEHFKLQIIAYGIMLEEASGYTAKRGFFYSIPKRKAEEVKIDKRGREKLQHALTEMHRVLRYERMPEPTPNRNKCLACEFRRFCNDVL
ncbi:MAG: CRISPR-associated protein Cas4 [Anaerolineales bacterium]|nr:CRISPR-associated protein Cas4 [Anaerolineales bacterium]